MINEDIDNPMINENIDNPMISVSSSIKTGSGLFSWFPVVNQCKP